jgi:hypothetical protein
MVGHREVQVHSTSTCFLRTMRKASTIGLSTTSRTSNSSPFSSGKVTLAGVDVPLTSGTVCIGVKDAVMLRVPVDGSGAVIRCSWILRAAPCKTTHLVLRSPYVCPEPVLGKRSVFGMKWHCKRCVFLYIYIYIITFVVPCGARTAIPRSPPPEAPCGTSIDNEISTAPPRPAVNVFSLNFSYVCPEPVLVK